MNAPQPRFTSRASDLALIVAFLGAISLPIVFQNLGLSFPQLVENRVRAPRPELKLQREALARFPAEFEAYYNDSFGLRDQLIGWNNRTRFGLLGVSTSPSVLIGKHGWLYYTAGRAIDDLRHSHPLTEAELAEWAKVFEERREWLARRGIRYLVMLAPDKHTIYPEFVRTRYQPVTPSTRFDQLYEYLHRNTKLELIDVRGPLREAKSQGRLYYRRDTHWNDQGGFVAYQTIVAALSRWYPDMKPWPRSAFKEVRQVRSNLDLALMLGLGNVMPEPEYRLEPLLPRRFHESDPGPGLSREEIPEKWPVAMESSDTSLPRAVVFRDSFSNALIWLLSEHFSRSLYIWHCPFDPAIVERERPHVVIEEAVERCLWQPPPKSGIPDTLIAGSRDNPPR